MTSSILVLGGTGKTGSRLTSLLRAQGVQARAASRRPQPGSGGVRFDWSDPAMHGAALAGADAVYLVMPDFIADGAPLAEPFLRKARLAGVRSVVAVTSMGVTFPTEPRDSPRRRLEDTVRASGLAWTILRPSGFNQNFSEGFLLPGIQATGAFATACGDGAVAFVDAGDIARVAAAALTQEGHQGREYLLTGPQALTFSQAAEMLSAAAGRPIAHRALDAGAMGELLKGAGMPGDVAEAVLRDQRAIREGHAAQVSPAVQEVTGAPARSFADFARDSAGAWARQG